MEVQLLGLEDHLAFVVVEREDRVRLEVQHEPAQVGLAFMVGIEEELEELLLDLPSHAPSPRLHEFLHFPLEIHPSQGGSESGNDGLESDSSTMVLLTFFLL